MTNLTLPVSELQKSLSEEKIQEMSVSEMLDLRQEINKELEHFYKINPGRLMSLLKRINERLFENSLDAPGTSDVADY